MATDAARMADSIYASAVRVSLRPIWTLPVLVAGRFDEERWNQAAEAAGCEPPDAPTRVAIIEALKLKVGERNHYSQQGATK